MMMMMMKMECPTFTMTIPFGYGHVLGDWHCIRPQSILLLNVNITVQTCCFKSTKRMMTTRTTQTVLIVIGTVNSQQSLCPFSLLIQQESAKNHICKDDKEFNNALMEQNIDAVLYMQAANSPDINLLDLFF